MCGTVKREVCRLSLLNLHLKKKNENKYSGQMSTPFSSKEMDCINRSKILDELRKKLIPASPLEEIVGKFKDELHKRLNDSRDSMLPSKLNVQLLYENVDELLLPYNHNKILAIDFGGTNLRVAVIKTYPELVIEHMNSIRIENKIVNEKFFEDIIQSIFVHLHERFFEFFFDNDLVDNRLINIPVAITFSFPLDSECKIITMGKGFIMTDEIKNQSLVVLLQRILRDLCSKNNLDDSFVFTIGEKIIINDSVAVHLMNTYVKQITCSKTETKSDNSIAFILGTGLNASFEQPLRTLPKFKQDDILKVTSNSSFAPDSKIVMNSEIGFLGLYGDNIRLTEFDYVPPNPNIIPMPLEYISGGRYLSMILYRILQHYGIYKELTELTDPEKFFNGVIFSKLLTLGTSYQTTTLHDSANEIMNMLATENLIRTEDKITRTDLEFLSDIAKIIISRAAKYVAAVLIAINQFVNEMNGKHQDVERADDLKKIDIGYVGSTLACTRYYQEQIVALAGGKIKLNFMQDSSLFGAAISTLL